MAWLLVLTLLVFSPPSLAGTVAVSDFSGTTLSAEIGATQNELKQRLDSLRALIDPRGLPGDQATGLSTWVSDSSLGPASSVFTTGDEVWVNTAFTAGGGTVYGIGVVYAIGTGVILPPGGIVSGTFRAGQAAYLTTGWKLTTVPYCVQAIGIHVLVDGGAPQFSVTPPFTICP